MNRDSKSQKDVKQLVKKVTVEEATQEVWKRFEKALLEMDEQSLVIFLQYLSGTPLGELSKKNHVEPHVLAQMVNHNKRELVRALKSQMRVKH